MSTNTYFKRIALVAVSALGLGVLSTVPANAAVLHHLSHLHLLPELQQQYKELRVKILKQPQL